MITVSVLTYNHEKYLSQAIESILMQKCDEPFEILIGDDCSTDGTGKIADDYRSRYPNIIRVIRPEKNMGAAQNSIRVIENARGEILSVCDGDDYWLREDVLQKQIDIFRSMPDVGMVCAKAKCFIQEKGDYQGTLGYAGAEDLMTMLRDNRDVAAPTIAFRTELMKKFLLENEWYIAHNFLYDTVDAYWFALYSKIKFIDEELAAYRVLPNSACHASTLDAQSKYQKRYFTIKWHFILTHQELQGEEIYDVWMNDYDQMAANSAYVSEMKVRSSFAYKIGKFIVAPLNRIKRIFVKA